MKSSPARPAEAVENLRERPSVRPFLSRSRALGALSLIVSISSLDGLNMVLFEHQAKLPIFLSFLPADTNYLLFFFSLLHISSFGSIVFPINLHLEPGPIIKNQCF